MMDKKKEEQFFYTIFYEDKNGRRIFAAADVEEWNRRFLCRKLEI